MRGSYLSTQRPGEADTSAAGTASMPATARGRGPEQAVRGERAERLRLTYGIAANVIGGTAQVSMRIFCALPILLETVMVPPARPPAIRA